VWKTFCLVNSSGLGGSNNGCGSSYIESNDDDDDDDFDDDDNDNNNINLDNAIKWLATFCKDAVRFPSWADVSSHSRSNFSPTYLPPFLVPAELTLKVKCQKGSTYFSPVSGTNIQSGCVFLE